MAAERNIVTSLLLVIISSLIVRVEVNLAMFRAHFSYDHKRRLDILGLPFLYHFSSVSFPKVTYPSNN